MQTNHQIIQKFEILESREYEEILKTKDKRSTSLLIECEKQNIQATSTLTLLKYTNLSYIDEGLHKTQIQA